MLPANICTAEAGKLAGVTRRAILDAIGRGSLPAIVRPGGGGPGRRWGWVVTENDLSVWMIGRVKHWPKTKKREN
jgi:hypothetical protein